MDQKKNSPSTKSFSSFCVVLLHMLSSVSPARLKHFALCQALRNIFIKFSNKYKTFITQRVITAFNKGLVAVLRVTTEWSSCLTVMSFIVKVCCVSCTDVERYSDKYHSSEQTDSVMDWTPGELINNHLMTSAIRLISFSYRITTLDNKN